MPVEGPLPAPTNLEGSMVLEILASGVFTHTHEGNDLVVHCTGIVFVSRHTRFEDRMWRCKACRLDHPENYPANEWGVHVIHLIGVISSFSAEYRCACGRQYYVLRMLDNCVNCGLVLCAYR
ncbi:hypothetical protein QAD02_004038 [Eretmocerus hayati]|uniref:Uncharacterized protein n=1 Tax=Eretmocerus hayati TaxID=131215 RepID=A0ACC2NPI4_9HYME|nr:hypothetical protein QAD02_004038 [Eretmocerus hayati]